jgi:UDP-glucose 4-epimerase
VTALPDWGTMDQREWDTSVWVSDSRAAFEQLGWKTSTSLSDGLVQTARWLQEQPQLWDRYGLATSVR